LQQNPPEPHLPQMWLLPSRPGEFHPEPLTEPDLTLSRHPARATARRLPPSILKSSSSRCRVTRSQWRWPAPFAPRALRPLHRYYEAVRPCPAHRYFRPRGCSHLRLFPWHRRSGSHVPYKSLVELRAAYMPDAARAVSGIPRADPGGRVTPRFWHRLTRFRHFCSGSLALASLNPACRILVPAFPQRSPPSLLTTAACGGLRLTPDCRPRRALLHLSYSCAPPYGPAVLVTQDPSQT
jgi:hypothetical protein